MVAPLPRPDSAARILLFGVPLSLGILLDREHWSTWRLSKSPPALPFMCQFSLFAIFVMSAPPVRSTRPSITTAVLGWRLKPHIKSKGFNTLDHGFRSNDGPDAQVLPGGVLAVGSSFTAGSEVNDDQSWPAHLQQLDWVEHQQRRSGRISGRPNRPAGRAIAAAHSSAGYCRRSHPRHHHRYRLRIVGLAEAVFHRRERRARDPQFSCSAKPGGRLRSSRHQMVSWSFRRARSVLGDVLYEFLVHRRR